MIVPKMNGAKKKDNQDLHAVERSVCGSFLFYTNLFTDCGHLSQRRYNLRMVHKCGCKGKRAE